jgi:hypothetical protein
LVEEVLFLEIVILHILEIKDGLLHLIAVAPCTLGLRYWLAAFCLKLGGPLEIGSFLLHRLGQDDFIRTCHWRLLLAIRIGLSCKVVARDQTTASLSPVDKRCRLLREAMLRGSWRTRRLELFDLGALR